MQSSRFDELTKALATPNSRRQALHRMAGILGGAVLAGLFPGLALASDSACAHFCASVFGADTPAASQCTGDAAHHKGLCYTCGPASRGGPQPICCPQNPDGTCSSYSGATCCGSSATCLNGSCCATANVCGSTCLAAPCDSSQCLTCNSSSGTCVSTCTSNQTCQNGQCTCVSPPPPPSGTSSLHCYCKDGTQVSFCATVDCFSSAAQDAICGPACSCHGGESGTGCLSAPPPPPPGVDSLQCTCKDGTQFNYCTTLDCFSSAAQDAICGPACSCHGGESGTGCLSAACGCFTSHTLIAMADGTSQPIRHVRVGDAVLGHQGHINRVVALTQPMLGQRPLYALNDDGHFVTAGHPFLTEDGWKSIDPTATARENPAMQVERLVIGDRLLSLTGAAIPIGGRAKPGETIDVCVTPIVLHRITSRPADPATPLYNLQLDGDHTYFANGLLVHNK